jgi:signal transduction histidine kinase
VTASSARAFGALGSIFSSLTNRIFLASAVLVVISTGVAISRVTASITARAESDLRIGLDEAATLVDDLSRTQFADFLVKGSLIADLPVLKAAAATNHPATVQPVVAEFPGKMGAALFVVLNPGGAVLAQAGAIVLPAGDIATLLAECRRGADQTAFWPYADGVVHAAAIPVESGGSPLGTLLVGFSVDRASIERFKNITASEIVLVAGPRVLVATLPPDLAAGVAAMVGEGGTLRGWIGDEEYIGRAHPLGDGPASDPVAVVLRSRTEHLRHLPPLRWQIAITGMLAVLVATGLGYAIARTVTRPLRALTASMREIAATGDLGRATPAPGRWDDEDARLLAATFDQLTDNLRRFQREAAQRERLSSLGRLSTVVAHEIRNPLMIIKSAVRPLRRHPSADVSATAQSIDEEVNRLNDVVAGVLDFAKPIRFEFEPADLVAVCRAASQAAAASPGDVAIDFAAATRTAPVVSDVERLRGVLVNVLANAQQAVRDAPPAPGGPAPIALALAPLDAGSWLITVRDRGCGISPEHLGRVFDPFFTTRRTGSGLGLAIARNVIEGLGGTISLQSRPGAGTEVRIELPAAPPAASASSVQSARTEVGT